MRLRVLPATILSIVALAVFCGNASAAVVAADSSPPNSCYLTDDGSVYCWGLGIADATVPTQVDGLTNASKVSVSRYFACAIDGGAVKCWGGVNDDNQLGDESGEPSADPVQVAGLTNGATDLAVGGSYACAVVSGALKCWGQSNLQHNAQPDPSPETLHTFAGLESGVTAVSIGHWGERICVIQNGAVKCAGDNSWNGAWPTPVAMTTVPGLTSGFTAVTAGYGINCALKEGGVWCWASNSLGIGPNNPGSVGPEQPIGLTSGVLEVQANDRQGACAIVTGGAVKCWGRNAMVDGANEEVETPIDTDVTSGATALAIEGNTGCVVIAGELRCNGWGFNGELGDGAKFYAKTPVEVLSSDVTGVSAGNYNNCAIVSGAAKCWGETSALGLPATTDATGTLPVAIPGLESGVAQLSWGESGGCAIVTGGAAKCWGRNESQQLGYEGPDSASAVQVPGLTSGVTKIERDGAAICALVSGSIKCWGGNNGTSTNPRVIVASGATDFDTSSNGPHHDAFGCAVVSGAARCWLFGGNSNFIDYLGNGNVWPSSSGPQQVTGLTSGVTSITTGGEFACATVAATVQCWGWGNEGQLGNSGVDDFDVPVQVTGLGAGVSKLEAGSNSICALVSGAVKCWGKNSFGQLGDNTLEDSSIAVQATGIASGATDVSVGHQTACAAVAGAAKCWGRAERGLVGPSLPLRRQARLPVATGVPSAPHAEVYLPEDDLLTGENVLAIDFDVSAGSVASCKIDETAYGTCPDEALPELPDGRHSLRVRATKGDGQIASAVTKFTIDTTPPVINITKPTNGSTTDEQGFDVDYTINEPLSESVCLLDGNEIEDCWWPGDWYKLDFGAHTISITATDLVGNVATAVTVFTVVPPTPAGPTPKVLPPRPVPPKKPSRTAQIKSVKVDRGGKARRGKIPYKTHLKFLPSVASAGDCGGKVSVKLSFGGKSVSTTGKAKLKGAACIGTYKLSVPKSWRGKKVSFTTRHAGNSQQFSFSQTNKVKLK